MALAAERAGHHVVGVVPGPSGVLAAPLEHLNVIDGVIPSCDLLIVAVPDDAIAQLASNLAGVDSRVACHLSGFTSADVLAPLRSPRTVIGALHPVQSLPDPELGSAALAGSHAAVSGDLEACDVLESFATSLGMLPFRLDDALRPLHHAAASAASNFVAAALALSQALAERAGVPGAAYQRLTETTIANVAEHGLDALTGPIARGDVGTVRGQLAAIARDAPELSASYVAMVRATAGLTDHEALIESILGDGE
jgi:predicted short-subunit dehydrogenase-like oxidoreductase (DUF2520 family)